MGGLGGGHYTAYCLSQDNKQWYLYDDSYCTQVNINDIKTPNAYVLFYKRRA
jgi:ubiquitin carboxyl-terminal hydrolase 4/11/15